MLDPLCPEHHSNQESNGFRTYRCLAGNCLPSHNSFDLVNNVDVGKDFPSRMGPPPLYSLIRRLYSKETILATIICSFLSFIIHTSVV